VTSNRFHAPFSVRDEEGAMRYRGIWNAKFDGFPLVAKPHAAGESRSSAFASIM